MRAYPKSTRLFCFTFFCTGVARFLFRRLIHKADRRGLVFGRFFSFIFLASAYNTATLPSLFISCRFSCVCLRPLWCIYLIPGA